MNIKIEIPQLDGLTAAIEKLAASYSGGAITGSEPKATRSPPKAKSAEPPAEEIDAGTGTGRAEEPTVTRVQLTVDHVKTMAVKLVSLEGGKDKMKTILDGLGATKFSEVPDDKLAEFAEKMKEAGVPLPAA